MQHIVVTGTMRAVPVLLIKLNSL